MIHGAHVMLQSKDPDADLAFLRDVLGQPNEVDAGGGFLIYALPPAELAVHEADDNDVHRLYLMCDDIEGFVGAMALKGVPVSTVHRQMWGLLVDVTMPSGGKLGVYEPKHASPKHEAPAKATAKTAKAGRPTAKAARKAPKKKAAKKPAKKASPKRRK
jgi:hypothetical protein